MNYYNENDKKSAEWLRELIKIGIISDGYVDERSILNVEPSDLSGFEQVHLFAGIGGWPYALRLAGIGDDESIWTGSCPCQPFSVAGKGEGSNDKRHLWPEMFRLIKKCRPTTVFGEQVSGKGGREWLSGVLADMEKSGYSVAAADLPAACLAAPHIRQRHFWVANSAELLSRLGDVHGGCRTEVRGGQPELRNCRAKGVPSGLGDAGHERPQGREVLSECTGERNPWKASMGNWIYCRDGKLRRIEPGLFALANGVPERVGLLRGYGNAIVPQVAALFVECCMEAINE